MVGKVEKLTGPERAEAFKKATELLKIVIGGAGLYLLFSYLMNPDEDDTGLTAKLQRRLALELGSSISALNIAIWFTFRPLQFAYDLSTGLATLVKLEKYKTSGSDYKKGDLKGINQLQRTLTLPAVRQFMPASKPKSSSSVGTGGLDFGFGKAAGKSKGLDFGF